MARTDTGLSASDAEQIAIALSEVLGQELMSDWVQITKEPAAGTYSVSVVREDVMARVRPYVDTPGWASITEPALVGYDLEGKPYYLPVKQHGQVIGMSTFGKSSLIHVLIAHVTRCADAILWVCGTQKLYDLVAGWIECYADTDLPLPIDWIAYGQEHTLAMLAALMRVARWRQSRPMSQRGGWPTIVMIMDEASFVLENRIMRVSFGGQMCTAAEMVANIARGAASGDAFEILASQRSTNDNFGDQGGTTTANLSYAAGFRSKDEAEIGRLMGDYQLKMPRHRGEYWLDAGNGDLPIRLKAPYIQTTDPTKPQLHSGLTIADVAWARRDYHTTLDAGSAQIAGPVYARRHTRMDDGLLRYLTEAVDLAPDTSAAQPDFAALVAAQIAAAGGNASARPSQETAPDGAVATLVGRTSRTERVAEIIRDASGPMTPADVMAELKADGDDTVQEQVVLNILSKLVTTGRAMRPERGKYVHCSTTDSDLTSNLTS